MGITDCDILVHLMYIQLCVWGHDITEILLKVVLNTNQSLCVR